MVSLQSSDSLFGTQIKVYDFLGLIGTVIELENGKYSASSIARFNHKAFDSEIEAVSWIVETVQNYKQLTNVA